VVMPTTAADSIGHRHCRTAGLPDRTAKGWRSWATPTLATDQIPASFGPRQFDLRVQSGT
jgi:hypothetical protein